MMTSSSGKNDNDEWHTPKYVLDVVKSVLGKIDLDPCSNDIANKVVNAKHYFTKNKNALQQEWFGKVFMNPPFSSGLQGKLLAKAINQYNIGNVSELIILTNSGTDTGWNQLLKGGIQAYTIGRIRFNYPNGDRSGSPSRGQVFTYYGDNYKKFIEEIEKNDFCYVVNKQLMDM